MLIGYARVSTNDQDLALQVDALNTAGCEKVFTDKASGAKAERPGLAEALAYARAGDTLVVWKLDRLGRTVRGLIDLVLQLQAGSIGFKSLTDGIDTSTAGGRFFFHVMAAFAEMERDLIQERTRAGLQAARKAGRIGGRKPAMSDDMKAQATRLLATGQVTPRDVAKTLGVSLSTLYRHIPGAASVGQQLNQQAGLVAAIGLSQALQDPV